VDTTSSIVGLRYKPCGGDTKARSYTQYLQKELNQIDRVRDS